MYQNQLKIAQKKAQKIAFLVIFSKIAQNPRNSRNPALLKAFRPNKSAITLPRIDHYPTDLSRYLKEGGTFKLAASAEFIERADALPAFEKAYDFTLNQNQLLSLAGGDTAVTIKAAAQQTSGVNAAMAYGTDGPVAALGLQTLSDPKGVQPIYAPAPVVRESVLQAYPQIADWLQPVFASLDEKTLQQLNARIAVEGLDAKKVAADYLRQKGWVK